MRKCLALASMMFLFTSCDFVTNGFKSVFQNKQEKKQQEQLKDKGNIYVEKVKNGEKKFKYPNGNIKSIVTYKDNLKVGVSHTFYKSGEKQYDIPYQKGKKHGKVVWYYKSGKVYRETEYKNGKKDGYQRKYWESGKLKSEMLFKKNMMALGLKEISNTDVVKSVPTIVVNKINHVKLNNELIVRFSLSNKHKKVKFYMGNLIEDKFFPVDGRGFFELKSKSGVAEYTFTINKGTQLIKNFNVIAVEKTAYQNQRILFTKVPISVRNPR